MVKARGSDIKAALSKMVCMAAAAAKVSDALHFRRLRCYDCATIFSAAFHRLSPRLMFTEACLLAAPFVSQPRVWL
jgi:hypothetical protein